MNRKSMRALARAGAVGGALLAGCSRLDEDRADAADARAVAERESPTDRTPSPETGTPPGEPSPESSAPADPTATPQTPETGDASSTTPERPAGSPTRSADAATPADARGATPTRAPAESDPRSAPGSSSAPSSEPSSGGGSSSGSTSGGSTPTPEPSEESSTPRQRVDGPHTVFRGGDAGPSQFSEAGSAVISTPTEGYLCELDVSVGYRTRFDYASQSGRPVDCHLYEAGAFEADPTGADPFASVFETTAFSVGPFGLTPGRTAVVVVPTDADEATVDYELEMRRSE